jgi:hypothetical protein
VRHEPGFGTGEREAAADQCERRLAHLRQVAKQPPAEGDGGVQGEADRVREQATVPGAGHELRREDALRHEDVPAAQVQPDRAGAARRGDVVDGDVRGALPAQLLDGGQRGRRIPRGRVVPVDDAEAARSSPSRSRQQAARPARASDAVLRSAVGGRPAGAREGPVWRMSTCA